MKLKYLSAIVAICSLAFGSCTTMRQSTVNTENVLTSVSSYTVADLEVQEKISVTDTWSYRPFNIGEGRLSVRKMNLTADAVKNANADVLLDAQYEYIKEPFGTRKLTVTGFPAKYTKFRKATPEDIEALKAVSPEKKKNVTILSHSWFKSITSKVKRFIPFLRNR